MRTIRVEFHITMFDMLIDPPQPFPEMIKSTWEETLETIKKLKEGTPQMTKDKPPLAFNVEMIIKVVDELETKIMIMLEEYKNPLPF